MRGKVKKVIIRQTACFNIPIERTLLIRQEDGEDDYDFAGEIGSGLQEELVDEEFMDDELPEFIPNYSKWKFYEDEPGETADCAEIKVTDVTDSDISKACRNGWAGEDYFVLDSSAAKDKEKPDIDQLEMSLADEYLKKNDTRKYGIAVLDNAANRGNLEASYRLAEIYAFGEGVEKNTELALEYLEKAMGLEPADTYLYLKKYQDTRPTTADEHICQMSDSERVLVLNVFYGTDEMAKALGIECSEQLAKAVIPDMPSRNHSLDLILGKDKFYGSPSGTQDYVSAFSHFLLAVESWFEHYADCYGFESDAMYHLGLMYLYGHYVPRNLFKAMKWFRMGADCGHKLSTVKLKEVKGLIECEGPEHDERFIECLDMYEEAAYKFACGDSPFYRDAVKYLAALCVLSDAIENAPLEDFLFSCIENLLPSRENLLENCTEELKDLLDVVPTEKLRKHPKLDGYLSRKFSK